MNLSWENGQGMLLIVRVAKGLRKDYVDFAFEQAMFGRSDGRCFKRLGFNPAIAGIWISF